MREGRWLHGAVLRPHRALQRGEKMEKDEHLCIYMYIHACCMSVYYTTTFLNTYASPLKQLPICRIHSWEG